MNLRRLFVRLLLPASLPVLFLAHANAQLGLTPPSAQSSNASSLLTDPTDSPGRQFLYELEAKFAKDTAEGGGKAFATWFASDAVSLSNKQPPEQGQEAIAASATWSPKDYQLTWIPDGGQMGPSGDMGFTWGHYSGHAKDKAGEPIVTTGRYMTIWKKQPNGSWKVVLDSSNEGPGLNVARFHSTMRQFAVFQPNLAGMLHMRESR